MAVNIGDYTGAVAVPGDKLPEQLNVCSHDVAF
jgi:hypothetical protein